MSDNSYGTTYAASTSPIVNPNGATACSRSSVNAVDGVAANDHIPHHSFFNYYASTSNPAHTRPASDAEIGKASRANQQMTLKISIRPLRRRTSQP
jgi:phospholipase C